MKANPTAAGSALLFVALAGCTAVFGEGDFAVVSSDASSASGSSGGSSSGGNAGADGAVGPNGDASTVCSSGLSRCAGMTPQTCIDERWENAGNPCSGATPVCIAGACKPCMPGTHQCQGSTGLQTCSDIGEWVTQQDCPYLCTGAGVCSGACMPSTAQCDGTAVQMCDSSGAWQFSTQCMYTCIDGACAGGCVPDTVQCTTSGDAVQTCDNTGTWQETACPDACYGGQCIAGACVPNEARCLESSNPPSSTPQLCDSSGAWQSQTACAQPTPDCQGGSCTCLETTCGSTCTDTTSDPSNCGGCGLDCQGQPCSGSACQPLALATDQDQPWGIALGASNCYWTNRGDGTVMTVAATGTGSPSQVASSQSSPTSIATDAMNVYWVDTTSGGAVLECALGGCSAPTALATGQSSPWGIAIPTSGGDAYFTAGPSARAALLTGAGVTVLGTESGTPTAIVTDGSYVYWSDASGAVFKCAAPGGCSSPTQLSPAVGQPSYGIAIDASNVYFSVAFAADGGAPAGVWMVSKTGTSSTLLASANEPVGVAVDPSTATVYFTDIGNGTVSKVSAGEGGAPLLVATGQSVPTGIVVGSAYVYWTNAVAGGTVMRMTK